MKALRARLRAMQSEAVPAEFPLDVEKANRSEAECELSITAYLTFRAGCEWRRGKPRYRQSEEFLYYLRALRLFATLRDLPPFECPCANCRKARAAKDTALLDLGREIQRQIREFDAGCRPPAIRGVRAFPDALSPAAD